MIADHDTNTIYFSDLLRTDPRFTASCEAILPILSRHQVDYRFLPATRDIWARDYMPIQVAEHKWVEYRFDPDYLQDAEKDLRKLKTYPDLVCQRLGLSTGKTDLILDGGNVIRSRNSVIMTDKVLLENKPTHAPEAVKQKLRELFEVENLVLIPWDPKDFTGHVDGMLRFIDEDAVLVNGIYNAPEHPFCSRLIHSIEEAGLDIHWLQVSDDEKNTWAYLNFLQTQDLLLVAGLGLPQDEDALAAIKKAFPEYASRGAVEQVNVERITQAGGALNCVSWPVLESRNA